MAATPTEFAVAPAPIWRLLWLWVPMLGIAVLDVGIDGLQCAEGRVVLARADGAQFVTER